MMARFSIVRQPDSTQLYSQFRDDVLREKLSEEYAVLNATMADAFEKAFTELEDPSYDLDLRRAMSICELHFESPSFSSCCGIGSTYVVINERGDLASCPMTLHRQTVAPSEDMIASTRLTFSNHSPTDREKNEGKNCLDCKWFPVCVSGCPTNNLAVNGKAFSVSPLNSFYEYVIPRYILFFARKLIQSAAKRGISDSRILAA